MDPATKTTLEGNARIALLADTHVHAGGPQLPPLAEAFAGCHLILHLGDCGEASALDRLAELAPVLATNGSDDEHSDERYARARLIVAGGLRVGALFDLAGAGIGVDKQGALSTFPDRPLREVLAATFGEAVDVVAFAATHTSFVAVREGVLFVNPGSATLPSAGRGTVAVLDLRHAVAIPRVVEL